MNPELRLQLHREAKRRTEAAARQLLDKNNMTEARENLAWAQLADEVRAAGATSPKHWYLVGIIILLFVVGLAWTLHKAANPMTLEIETDTVNLQLRNDWRIENGNITADRFILDNLAHVQVGSAGIDGAYEYLELEGREAVLHQFHVAQGAQLSIHSSGNDLKLFVKQGTLKGELRLREGPLMVTGNAGYQEYDIDGSKIEPPESARFSAALDKGQVFTLDALGTGSWRLPRLQSLELGFNREEPPGSGRMASGIVQGHITFPQSGNRKQELLEADIVRLQGAHSARLVISRTDSGSLKVQFQGEVDHARAGPEGFVKNITPTWLEYFYHHQQLAIFWSAVVFLSGFLWKLRNFL